MAKVSILTDLESRSGKDGGVVKVYGSEIVADGFYGEYVRDADSTETVDGVNVIATTGIPVGRWKRINFTQNVDFTFVHEFAAGENTFDTKTTSTPLIGVFPGIATLEGSVLNPAISIGTPLNGEYKLNVTAGNGVIEIPEQSEEDVLDGKTRLFQVDIRSVNGTFISNPVLAAALELKANASALNAEINTRISADISLQGQIFNKANISDISAQVIIEYDQLTDGVNGIKTEYINSDLAERTYLIEYYTSGQYAQDAEIIESGGFRLAYPLESIDKIIISGDVISITSIAALREQVNFLNTDYIFNDYNIAKAFVDKSGKVLLGLTTKGGIINPDFEALRNYALATNDLVAKEYGLNDYSVVKAWTDKNGKILLGIKSNGDLVNPMLQRIIESGIGGGDGILSESDTQMMFGNHLFVVNSRDFNLYGSSILPTRNKNAGSYCFSIQSVNETYQPLHELFQLNTRLNGSWFGTTAILKLRSNSVDKEHTKNLTIIKSSLSKVATPIVQVIGDSLTYGGLDALVQKFTGLTVAPTFVGTRKSVAGTNRGEGRAGWEAADFTYITNTNGHAPVSIGGEAANWTDGTSGQNPFIRVSTGGDPSGDVKNGYIFDYGFYLSRYAAYIPHPDIILINLGTNDITRNGVVTGLANAIEGIRIIVKSIKAALPACKVCLHLSMVGVSTSYNNFWANGYFALWKSLYANYGDKSSEGIYLLNTHAYMTSQYIFPLTIQDTNDDTGETIGVLDDPLHFTTSIEGQHLYAEPVFQFIHAIS